MSEISKFCDIVQFLYHNDDDCFQFDFNTRTLELIVAKSYLPTQSGIFQLAQFLSYSEIVEYRRAEETQKDFTHKYPGMIAGLKTFADYLKNCRCINLLLVKSIFQTFRFQKFEELDFLFESICICSKVSTCQYSLEICSIYSVAMFHVGAKSALLQCLFMPTAKKTSSARSLAPPLQIEPTSLGFDLVFGADLWAAASFLATKGILCGHLGEQGGLRNTPDKSGVFLIFSLIYWLEKHFDRSKLHQYFEETTSGYIF